MSLTRRAFLRAAAVTAAAGLVLDPERLLWVPGAKTFFLPSVQAATEPEVEAIVGSDGMWSISHLVVGFDGREQYVTTRMSEQDYHATKGRLAFSQSRHLTIRMPTGYTVTVGKWQPVQRAHGRQDPKWEHARMLLLERHPRLDAEKRRLFAEEHRLFTERAAASGPSYYEQEQQRWMANRAAYFRQRG